MENNIVVDYDEKNIEDYVRLANLLFNYHSGMPMKKDAINIIAQATPEQRVQAMNLLKMQSLGITSKYGVMEDINSYNEKLGEALVSLYYSQRELTKDQLLLITTATDEEKLEALESYSREHYAMPGSAIGSMDLSNEENRISRKK